MDRSLVIIGGIVLIAIVLFLALRELVLWYWKIDKTVQLLEEIRDVLVDIKNRDQPSRGRMPDPDPYEPSIGNWIRRAVRRDVPDEN